MKAQPKNSFKIIAFFLFTFSFFLFPFSIFSLAQDVEWEKLFLYDAMGGVYNVSSELEVTRAEDGDIGKYSAAWLFDQDLSTAWVEGVKGHGVGEYVFIGLENDLPDKIHINNGYQKSKSLYFRNSRPKSLKLTLFLAYRLPADVTELGAYCQCLHYPDTIIIQMKDEMGRLDFDLSFNRQQLALLKETGDSLFREDFGKTISEWLNTGSGNDWYESFYAYILKLEILEVYEGSRWDDTCISDIWFSSEEKGNKAISPYEIITGIFEADDGNIYFSTSKQEKILLASPDDIKDEDDIVGGKLDIEIMDVSSDKEWLQIDFLFSHEAYSRVEEVPFLYNVRHKIKIDKSLLGDYFSMYGFVEKEGKLFIDTNAGIFDLEVLLKAIEEMR